MPVSKRNSWNDLLKQVEVDPWGLPYKLVTKKLVGRRPIPGLSAPGRVESIVDALFSRGRQQPPGHHVRKPTTSQRSLTR